MRVGIRILKIKTGFKRKGLPVRGAKIYNFRNTSKISREMIYQNRRGISKEDFKKGTSCKEQGVRLRS